jgi:2-polyprenyl-3-methyl-5-hydroxy-6-metoxy-1,4-benzoquinol methylase
VTKRGHDVLRCRQCRVVFAWPQPTAEEIEARYSAEGYHADADEPAERRLFAARLAQIEEQMPRRGRVLDVGCARGTFLAVARDEGWDAAGLDLDRKAVDAASDRGLDVRHGALEPGTFAPNSFDAVTLFDLIEHVPDPRGLLAVCREMLRPDGLLVITTPDVSGLVPRVTYLLFGLTIGAWGHPTPPGHLVQFSRRALRRLLDEEGFEVVALRREHIPMGFSVGKLEDSIVEVLTGRHRVREAPGAEAAGLSEDSDETGTGGGGAVKRLARLAIRALCWIVVGATGWVARLTGQGDSMRVIAQRKRQSAAK